MNITKNTESSSIVVQWDEVDDSLPTTYTVVWTSERDHMMQSHTLEEQSSYTIVNLTLDTVYTITVTPSNKCGAGPEYSTSVSLTTDATSTISSLSSTNANPMTIMSTTSSINTNSATAILSTNSTTATIISSTATISNSATYIIPLSTTTATVVMSSDATTTNLITTAVSIITDTTSSFTGTSGLQATIDSSNHSTSATTIVMYPMSTANPPDTTTADETSKFSGIKCIQ